MNINSYASGMLKTLALAMALCATLTAQAAVTAGKVEILRGKVQAIGADNSERQLAKGDPVFEGDRVLTKRRSLVMVRFEDNTKFALGSNAEMAVDRFSNTGSAEDDAITTRVVKGAFRFVSGLIAKRKPSSMSVRLAVATIGIRGTHVAGEATEDSATIVLLEPDEEEVKLAQDEQVKVTAIDVSNQFGAVAIDKAGYGTTVPDKNSPPTPPQRMRLRTIDNLMRSISNAQRVSVPRPVMR